VLCLRNRRGYWIIAALGLASSANPEGKPDSGNKERRAFCVLSIKRRQDAGSFGHVSGYFYFLEGERNEQATICLPAVVEENEVKILINEEV